MLNIRHILRLHTQNQTMSEIIIQTGIYRPILKKIIKDFKESKLSFSEINELSDKDLEELFEKPQENLLSKKLQTLYDLFPEIDKELKRTGVTKVLLWEEYKKKHPDGASCTAFRFHFSRWKARKTPIMRQNHKAGDKLFIDFAGEKLMIIDIDKLMNGKGVCAELGEEVYDDYWMYYLTKDMAQALEISRPYTNLKSYLEYKQRGHDILEKHREEIERLNEEEETDNDEGNKNDAANEE